MCGTAANWAVPSSADEWGKRIFSLTHHNLFLWSPAAVAWCCSDASWTHLVIDEDKHDVRLVLLRPSWSVALTVPTTLLRLGLLGKQHVQSEQNAKHGQHSSSSGRRMRRAPHLYWSPAGDSSEIQNSETDRWTGGRRAHVGAILQTFDLAGVREALPSVADWLYIRTASCTH